MTESEWLASEDSALMLARLEQHALHGHDGPGYGRKPSDRKLRLFACACCRAMDPRPRQLRAEQDSLENEERAADENNPGPDGPYWWISSSNLPTRLQAIWATLPPPALRPVAALLRDIVGSPFRPVTLPPCDRCGGDGVAHGSNRPFEWTGPGTYPGPCPKCEGRKSPLVTPAVVSLAQAAYDGRDPVTGHMDSLTLAAVADALEEAGCCEPRKSLRVVVSGRSGAHEWDVVGRMQGEEVMRHTEKTLQRAKRWAESNLSANGWERWGGWGTSTSTDWQSRQPCLVADGLTPATAHPILAHLREPGPHVRGCWAIDLILGKE